ncbi:MAG TPA: hypothetical protein VF008_04090 [Niastella sp.]
MTLKKYHLHISAILLLAVCHLQFAGREFNKRRMLYPGCITTGNQVVTLPNIPAPLIATPASGGNCGGSYAYQWMISEGGLYYTEIAGATGPSLSFLPHLQAVNIAPPGTMPDPKRYYIRRATCGSEVKYTAPVTITRQ